LATYKYSDESILFGRNSTIPKYDKNGNRMDFSDDLLNSAGIYSKKDINNARFTRFSRFGRVLDPYGKLNPGREYLFFVKPDLHICVPANKPLDDTIYKIGGFSKSTPYTGPNGMRLNPQLSNNPYFKDLIDTHPDVIKDLQVSADPNNDPFSRLLSFTVSSNLTLGSSDTSTMDNPATIFGTNYKYIQDSEASDEAFGFSLEFLTVMC